MLVESDLNAFSIDAVAVRSGVARTTIHRWWSSKGMLAMECFVEHILADFDFRISDSAAADFNRVFADTVSRLSGFHGKVIMSIIAEGQRDPAALDAFMKVYFWPVRNATIKVVQAGIDRGEFRADLDPVAMLDGAIGAVYSRLLLRLPISPDWAANLADLLLTGALAPAAKSPAAKGRRAKDGAATA